MNYIYSPSTFLQVLFCILMICPLRTVYAQTVPACNSAVSQMTSTGGICVGCIPSNAPAAVDNSTTTYSSLSVILGLLNGYIQQTLTFPFTGTAADSIKLLLGFPAPVSNFSEIQNVSVVTYNGNTINGSPASIYNHPGIVLQKIGSTKVLVSFKPGTAYNKLQVRLNSATASLLGGVYIYYAARQLPPPAVADRWITICENGSATFTATGPAGATFRWYDEFDSLVHIGPSYTATEAYFSQSFFVTAAAGDQCAAGLAAEVKLKVNDAPEPPLITGDLEICSGSSAVLTATGVHGRFYSWYDQESGGSPLFTGPEFTTPALNSSADYYVEEVDSLGCSSLERSGVYVNVYETPEAPLVFHDPVCPGATTELFIYPEEFTDYYWYADATTTQPLDSGIYYNLTVNTPVTVYAQAVRDGCTSGREAVEVTPLPPAPTPVFMDTTLAICKGDSIDLKIAPPANGFYVWMDVDSFDLIDFDTAVINVKPPATNTYAVFDVGADGCSSDFAFATVTVTDCINGLNKADTVYIYRGQRVQLTARGTPNGAIVKWYGSPTDNKVLGMGNTFTTPALINNNVYYSQIAKHKNRTPIYVMIKAAALMNSIPDTHANNDIPSVYPNPFNGPLYIKGSVDKESLVLVQLTDMNGRMVRQKSQQLPAGVYNWQLDGQDLTPGVYWCRVMVNGKTTVFKVVKH